MSSRKTPLTVGSYYHVYNRGINHQEIFHSDDDYQFFLRCTSFYRHSETFISFSRFRRLVIEKQDDHLQRLEKEPGQVEIICYCLMPNHFHFARYYNLKQKRSGPLFEGRFKSAFIETDEQLLRLSAYIHLNPYSARIVNQINELKNYSWSSYKDYLEKDKKIKMLERGVLLGLSDNYQKLVENYQPRESTPGVDNLKFD